MSAGSKSHPLLSVSDLSITIGRPANKVVNRIGFTIGKGEILGLAGESGSGKSLTALGLTRLLPTGASAEISGRIKLSGTEENLLDLGEGRLRRIRGSRIAYIFQEPSSSFNPVFTIASHLNEVLKLAGVPRAKRPAAISAALETVGIEATRDHLEAYPAAFSGGMLQRLAIACAIATGPDLLIADEPTTALDTSTQKRITDLLIDLNQNRGMAILFISHNLGLLKQIAKRLLVMKDGRIVEEGPSDRILTDPQHPYTRSLVQAVPKLKA